MTYIFENWHTLLTKKASFKGLKKCPFFNSQIPVQNTEESFSKHAPFDCNFIESVENQPTQKERTFY
jgi:hypothetical protein